MKVNLDINQKNAVYIKEKNVLVDLITNFLN